MDASFLRAWMTGNADDVADLLLGEREQKILGEPINRSGHVSRAVASATLLCRLSTRGSTNTKITPDSLAVLRMEVAFTARNRFLVGGA